LLDLTQVINNLLTYPVNIHLIIFFLLGSALGSFSGVVVARFPKRQDLVYTPSNCPCCHRPIPFWLNIPVLGWFMAGGRCRTCRIRISPAYPLLETAFGMLYLGQAFFFGWGPLSLTYLAFFSLLCLLAMLDQETHRLYDVFTLPMIVAGVLVSAFFPALLGGLWGSALGALVCGGLLAAVAWLGSLAYGREAMGWGDVKLMAAMGGFLGLRHGLEALLLASLIGGLAGAMVLLLRRGKGQDALPFGPCLAAGGILSGVHLLLEATFPA
jgi:leader peptidase (prepilin peptidase)/N-methyltransferase